MILVFKTDFRDRVRRRVGFLQEPPPDQTAVYRAMLQYHRRGDANVPDRAVLFFGDSITQGLCVAALACPAVNYGIGEDTTGGLLKRLPLYGSVKRAAVVVVAVGVNDLAQLGGAATIQNHSRILEALPAGTPVVVSALLPVDERLDTRLRGWNGRIRSLNTALRDLCAAKPGCHYLDAGPRLVDASGQLAARYHDGDGSHLNAEGYAVWIAELRPFIVTAHELVGSAQP